MSSMSMMIAAAMQEKKRPGSLVAGAKKGAAIAERKRVDEFSQKGRSTTPVKKKPVPGQVRSQKAASRRSSITKKVAPAGTGYQNLIDALGTGKKK